MNDNTAFTRGLTCVSLFALTALVIACPALTDGVFAASQIVVPSAGFSAHDIPSTDCPEAWSVSAESLAVYDRYDGLQIFDRESGTLQQSLGRPEEYIGQYIKTNGGVWAGFVAPDPSEESFWVGFTIDYPSSGYVADDRIYEVDLQGNWVQRGKLTGNFDIDFYGEDIFVCANPHANQSGWPPGNSIYLFDAGGTDNHDLIAEVEGNSYGLGVDAAGNIYQGTYNTKKMYRFTPAQVAAAIGPTYLTVADAEMLFNTPGGCYDTDVDACGHVVFSTNDDYPAGGRVMVWAEGYANGDDVLVQIAAGIDSYAWLTMVDVVGDALAPTGTVYATDYFADGIAEISAELIPGDANLDGRVDDVDATIFACNWLTTAAATWAHGDFNSSGSVDQADAAILAANWHKTTLDMMAAAATASVPESSSLILLLAGGACVAAIAVLLKRTQRDADHSQQQQ